MIHFRGTIKSIEDHGTIVVVWVETTKGKMESVNFDHRCFQNFVDGEFGGGPIPKDYAVTVNGDDEWSLSIAADDGEDRCTTCGEPLEGSNDKGEKWCKQIGCAAAGMVQ